MSKRKQKDHMANIAIKYRIYPTLEQRILLARTFGCTRKVWNLMLEDRNAAYEKDGSTLKPTPAQYKDECPYLKEVDSLALCNAQLDLERAFSQFFDACKGKRKGKLGKPKFKSRRHSSQSYTTNVVGNNLYVEDNRIRLPKVGFIEAVIHRTVEDALAKRSGAYADENGQFEYALKSATVSKESDGSYYCSVLYEYRTKDLSSPKGSIKAKGLDYKSDGLYCDDEGNIATEHKYYKESQEKLARAQKKLSRKVGSRKGEDKSKNWLKQNLRVNKIHRHIANQRYDFLQKQSTEITNQCDVVCVESINLKAIGNKKNHLGKATADNGFGKFRAMLKYKMADRGKYYVEVPQDFPSSQLCHCCGYKNPEVKNLKIRRWTCPECGAQHDRDINAAINIKNKGLQMLGLA